MLRVTTIARAIDADHLDAASRLPGGGPRSRWSPRRLAPSAWWWTGATLVLLLAAPLLLVVGPSDPGLLAGLFVGDVMLLTLVFSWTWGTVGEAWRHRVRDDVRRHATGCVVTLRTDSSGDEQAVADVEVGDAAKRSSTVEIGGRHAGTLRDSRRTRRALTVGGRVHTLERGAVTDPRTGRRDRSLAVRDSAGRRAIGEAVRLRRPGADRRAAVDWRLTVGRRVLWVRVLPGRSPRRRTLLDDHGRAWLVRPVVSDEPGLHGLTARLPGELDAVDAAALVWLLAEIERDAARGTGRGRAGTGTDVDDLWTRDDDGGGSDGVPDGAGGGGGGGDSWW